MKSEDLIIHSLKAISPIDGRHRIMTEPLSEWFSEFALFKYRLKVEVEYLVALSDLEEFTALRSFTDEEKEFLRMLIEKFSLADAQTIQNIDRFGYKDKKPTNHDCKSVEYFLKEKIQNSSLNDVIEFVHFGLTSEDVNNIAYNYMINGCLNFHYVPSLIKLLDKLSNLVDKEKNTAMLGRTHGQPATPTTFGKEMANYLERIRKQLVFLQDIKLPGKLNGAVGNHAAQEFTSPEVDWISFTESFIRKLGFEENLFTTQIEPHDGLINLFNSLISINNILRDLAVNLWLYISNGYMMQEKVEHEVGSSTMPHKINPWRAEVAEGSAVEANAKLSGFVLKLQHSRLQRDLSDHEAQRAIGVGIAHSYLTILHLLEELGRLNINKEKINSELSLYGSILTEAVQTLLRKEGYEKPYELMKDFSRGKHCTVEELHQFVDSLEIKDETKQKLKGLRPENYIGLSVPLCDIALKRWKEFKDNYQEPMLPITEIIFDYSCFEQGISDSERKVLESMKQRGMKLIALTTKEAEIDGTLFSEQVNEKDLTVSNRSLFVGIFEEEENSLFHRMRINNLICVNYLGEVKSEYNILTLEELPYLVDSLNEEDK
jgi:adenylosuccinate lyase